MPLTSRDFTVVVPCFRSTALEPLVDRLCHVFVQHAWSFEVLLVDDGSDDGTWDVICRLHERHPKDARGIRLAQNVGQHNATLCGLRHARGRTVVTIDDDLQTPPESIPELVDALTSQHADLVYGVHGEKRLGAFRDLGASFIGFIGRREFGPAFRGSSFRVMKRELAERLAAFPHPWVFLDGLVFWHTRAVASVTVPHQARAIGRSGYSLTRLVELTARFVMTFSSLPSIAITTMGLVVSALSAVAGLVVVVARLVEGTPSGWVGMIVVVSFLTGMVLVAVGFLGEYLRRILVVLSGRPPFAIRQTTGDD